MRKAVISLVTAASLLLTTSAIDAKASVENGQASTQNTQITSNTTYTYEVVEKVSTSKATAKKGSFKLKHNTNVRTDAGTKNKIIITAKKGATATATHQKKVGKETWYKVKVSGKSGWVLSTLLTPTKAPAKKVATKAPAKKVAAKAPAKATTNLGTFETKHNSNIRTDAGTKNKIVTLAKKGTTVTATAQKKVGKITWYKVSANGKTGWVSGDLLTKTTTAKAPAKKKAVTKVSNSTSSSDLISNAMALRGVPYRFGGSTTSGFDCSGYVQYVFKQSGKSIPRDTLGQYAATKKVTNPQPGDLVFFAGTYRSGISHVGIYIGNNQFIQAAGKNVHVRSMSDSYWSKYFHSYRSF